MAESRAERRRSKDPSIFTIPSVVSWLFRSDSLRKLAFVSRVSITIPPPLSISRPSPLSLPPSLSGRPDEEAKQRGEVGKQSSLLPSTRSTYPRWTWSSSDEADSYSPPPPPDVATSLRNWLDYPPRLPVPRIIPRSQLLPRRCLHLPFHE